MLRERIESVRERIGRACARVGRDPATVTLVAVTKGVPIERIREAVALGLTELGENRVQEARAKQQELAAWLEARGSRLRADQPTPNSPGPTRRAGAGELRTPNTLAVKWHLIGHLQRNKARHAVELFGVIHSVDSPELITVLEQAASSTPQAPSRARIQVFIQVNVSGESTKFGCRPEEARRLAEALSRCAHLTLRGLMTMAPWSVDPEDTRPHFQRLRELRDVLVRTGSLQPAACSLSMGMSQDFEVAIEEGADVVRIGTAIFGERT